jgi:hypothetical protein
MGSMSTTTACWLIAAVLFLVGLLLLAFALCRVSAGSAAVDESRSRVWDTELGRWVRLPYGTKPGPGQLTEAEVDARDRCQLLISELDADPFDPRWDAGCERLWDAIRDEQKGDQA